MENILIVKSNSFYYVCDQIKYISTSREAIKEMGEPFLVDKSQFWIFAYVDKNLVGFIAYKGNTILYVYIIPEYRNKGLFTILYNELPIQEWVTVASNASLKAFLGKGFQVVKNYKNCHKLIKK